LLVRGESGLELVYSSGDAVFGKGTGVSTIEKTIVAVRIIC